MKNHAENEAVILDQDLFLFFKKALHVAKVSVLQLSLNKPFKILDYYFRDMLNFDFLEKGLGIVSSPHFAYDFSSCYILLTNQISLSDYLYIVRYWATCALQLPVIQAVTS